MRLPHDGELARNEGVDPRQVVLPRSNEDEADFFGDGSENDSIAPRLY